MQTTPLKYLVSCNDEVLSEKTDADYEFDYIEIGSVEYGKGITSTERMTYGKAPSRARRIVKRGDVIISTVRTYLKAVAYINDSHDEQIASTGFAVLRPTNIYDRFLYYSVLADDFIQKVEANSVGISYPAITTTKLMTFKIPTLPLYEQQAIANYLDDRCSKIDTIIAEAKASIEEYKELKQAVIYEAVTKGLDKTVEMKHYNDWFDKCPSNWEYKQIRYLYELRDERNFKPLSEVNLISLYTDQGVIQHADIEKTSGNKAITADGYKKVYPEDIVVNIILCWMGAMGRSEYQGVTSPAYDVYKPIGGSKVCSRYYHYLFRTDRFSKKCYTVGRGIMMMRWRTYSSQFRAIKVPVPPYNEQIEIANYLDKRISHMEELINAKQSLIEDLEAYKKSLIYEVVTGKRKVVA